jgi:ribonucleoside-diphosphate reductase alpha chain
MTTATEPSDATNTLRANRSVANGNGKDGPNKQAGRPSIEQNGAQSPPRGVRHRLPPERISLTHHFTIAGQDGYITVGLFPDGQPGEIFINIAKEGSTLGGLMNSFAEAISIGLQHGVPLRLFCEKFSHTRFEPSGWTSNPAIGFAKSIMDYIARWLQFRFVDGPASPVLPNGKAHESGLDGHHHPADALRDVVDMGDAPSCNVCGAICSRSGACFRCLTCGQTTGCS